MRKLTTGCMLGALFACFVYAQIPDLQFEHLTVNDGLSDSVILCILQDHLGFIWIGTQDGLNRYDGYEIKVYRHDPDDPSSLGHNYVYDLCEDKAGNLWVATSGGGLCRFERGREKFTRFRNDPSNPFSLSDNQVDFLFKDRDNNFWIGTGNGLNRMDKGEEREPKFIRYQSDPDDLYTFSGSTILSIMQDRRGVLWFGTDDGLCRVIGEIVDSSPVRFIRYRYDPENHRSLMGEAVTALYEDFKGDIWVGTNRGLCRLIEEGHDDAPPVFFRYDFPNPQDSLSFQIVWFIYEDRYSDFWIGTDNGLRKLDRKSNRFFAYRADPGETASLSHNTVYTITEDASGIIWIGTRHGVNKLRRAKVHFTVYQYDPDDAGSISHNEVRSIYEDQSGDIWIGTTDGVCRLSHEEMEKSNPRFFRYHFEENLPGEFGSDSVMTIGERKPGEMWFGSYGGGVIRLVTEPGTGKSLSFARYSSTKTNLAEYYDNLVMSVHADRWGDVWVGTMGQGLKRYIFSADSSDFEVKRFLSDPSDPSSLSHNSVAAIYEDRSGVLWFGTHGGGLSRFDRESGTFHQYRSDPENPDSLNNNFIRVIYEDAAGTLWLGTYGGGLNRMDRETGKFRHYLEKDGLSNNLVCGILEDSRGRLWISTNHGLSLFDPRNESFKNYYERDGIGSNEFIFGAFGKASDGRMFFGSEKGLISLIPEQTGFNPHPPPIVFTDFFLEGRKVSVGEDSPLRMPLQQTDTISLSHRDSSFSFQVAALDFHQPENNHYAYKLEGRDQDWIDLGTDRRIEISGLSPGAYVLRVKASNNDGIWNNQGISMEIFIRTAFWSTWWFRGLIFAAVVVLLLGSFMLRKRLSERKDEGGADAEKLFREAHITNREREVIMLLLEGKNNQDIGRELYISMKTVKSHIYNIYRKLGIKNRLQLSNLLRNRRPFSELESDQKNSE